MTFLPRNPVPAASRYSGIAVGPRLDATFETQQGIPIDGTNASARALCPFTLALRLPPEFREGTSATVLSFASAAGSTGASNDPGFVGTAASAQSVSLQRAANAIVSAASAPRPSGYGLPAVNTLSDVFTAADIRAQIEAMRNAPPLTLLVNPAEMSVSFEKVQSYQERTRNGFLFQAWGENLPTISFSGSTAGFVAGSSRGVQGATDRDTGSASGYQWASRKDSAAWQNFVSLMHFYRSNGYVYDTIGKSEAHLFIGSVVITYDDWEYEGHIDSLNFSFDEASPHRVQFDMQFTASHVIDLAPPGSQVSPLRNPGPSSLDPIVAAGMQAAQGGVAALALGAMGVAAGATSRRLEKAVPPSGDDV